MKNTILSFLLISLLVSCIRTEPTQSAAVAIDFKISSDSSVRSTAPSSSLTLIHDLSAMNQFLKSNDFKNQISEKSNIPTSSFSISVETLTQDATFFIIFKTTSNNQIEKLPSFIPSIISKFAGEHNSSLVHPEMKIQISG